MSWSMMSLFYLCGHSFRVELLRSHSAMLRHVSRLLLLLLIMMKMLNRREWRKADLEDRWLLLLTLLLRMSWSAEMAMVLLMRVVRRLQ